MRRIAVLVLASALAGSLAACGGDASGPSQRFPALDPALVAALCVRGDVPAGERVSGSIAATDCDAAGLDPPRGGYYDAWRVREPAAGSVTIATSSIMDTYLRVFRLEGWSGTAASLTLVGEDDDSGPTFNALLAVSLEAHTDYLAVVSGFDYPDVGNYTLSVQ